MLADVPLDVIFRVGLAFVAVAYFVWLLRKMTEGAPGLGYRLLIGGVLTYFLYRTLFD